MNIYEVTELETEIENIAMQNDGEVPEELLQQLIEMQMATDDKIENICKYITNSQALAISIREEEKRLADKRRSIENKVENIKKYLLPYVQEKGKVTTGSFTLSTRKSQKVEIVNEELLPEAVFRIKKEVNKELLKDMLKYTKFDGATLTDNYSLQIK